MRAASSLAVKAMAIAILGVSAPAVILAQTAIWNGGGTDINYTNPTNWQGGVVPDNSGSYTIDLSFSNDIINVNTAANVLGISYLGTINFNGTQFQGTAIQIGSGGISPGGGAGSTLSFTDPIVLTANQTWTGASGGDYGFISSNSGVSGAFSLTVGNGQVYMNGTNTFSGGLIVSGTGTFYPGTDTAAGTGPITLQDGATMKAWNSGATLSNPVTLGNNVTLGLTSLDEILNLSGTVAAANATTTLNVSDTSSVTLSGEVTGAAGTAYTISGASSAPPADGGSQLVITGSLVALSSVTASSAAVILAPTSPNALNALGVTQNFYITNGGYLGLDGSFTTPGYVAAFFADFAAGMAGSGSFNGTIGFDNVENPGTPNTFGDNINLGAFSSTDGFLGLGSATQAILTGTISPTLDGYFIFGGGGGTLTVTSNLEGCAAILLMTSAPSPLTLIFQGDNGYTQGVVSQGGVLVLDSNPTAVANPMPSSITLEGGYVGYTEESGLSSQAFIGLFNPGAYGVIGFDQHSPTPGNEDPGRQIGDTIDLSGFDSDGPIFLGTSTSAEFTTNAVITPYNHNYAFTGVKGGHLTVDTVLTDEGSENSLTLGLVNPIESNASTSVVNITGTNTFSGGTTINTGTVFINNGSAFGTGPIDIPGTSSNDIPYVASYGGNPILVANPITVGSNGSSQGVTLGSITPSGNDMLILNGVISDENEGDLGIIAIAGPVTLNAANTYSGGTLFTGTGSAVALVGNSSGFGTGPITIQDGAQIAPIGADIAFANPISLVSGSPLELGNSGDSFMLTLNGVISGNGNLNITSDVTLNGLNTYTGLTTITDANVIIGSSSPFGTGGVTLQDNATLAFSSSPTVNDLNGDESTSINLTTGQVLTLVADSSGGSYSGAINGDMTNTVTKTGGGVQQLFGAATYGGGTDVNAGVLVVGAAGSVGVGMVTVATGAEFDVADGAILTVPVTLSGNAILGGSGTFSPAAPFTFSGGGTVSPGIPINSEYVSTLSFGSGVTFGTGGVYNLNVANAGGVAGTDYSTIFVTGTLALTAAPGSFTIAVNSIGSGGSPGPAIFNPAQPYSLSILTTSTGITGFSPTLFTVNTTNFQNSLAGGSFAVGDSGDTLTLNFTPVPEPSTWALMLTGVGAVGAAIRRRRRT